jgi:hypothetical protein
VSECSSLSTAAPASVVVGVNCASVTVIPPCDCAPVAVPRLAAGNPQFLE